MFHGSANNFASYKELTGTSGSSVWGFISIFLGCVVTKSVFHYRQTRVCIDRVRKQLANQRTNVLLCEQSFINNICMRLLAEPSTTASEDRPAEDTRPARDAERTNDNSESVAVVTVTDNDAAVKFTPNGKDGTADGALDSNGPSVLVPSTSADAVIKTEKTDKEEKAKKEKPNAVGMLELVKFFVNNVYGRH